MSVDAKRFRLMDGVAEIIGEIVLLDGDGKELSLCLRRHFAGNFALVVFGPVEGESKCADWFRMMTRREPQHRTGIDATAEITTDWNIRAETQANRFVQCVTKLFGVLGIGALGSRLSRLWVVKIPVAS